MSCGRTIRNRRKQDPILVSEESNQSRQAEAGWVEKSLRRRRLSQLRPKQQQQLQQLQQPEHAFSAPSAVVWREIIGLILAPFCALPVPLPVPTHPHTHPSLSWAIGRQREGATPVLLQVLSSLG